MDTVSKDQYDHLKAKFERLVRKVRMMRENQRQYFTFRSSSYLKSAKRYEHEVDALLKEEIQQQKQAAQGSLF